MKIDSIRINNFKLLHKIEIEPGNVNVIIGANGSGKSSILEAIGLLSLALTDRIDDLALQRKGIRLSTPEIFKSSFAAYRKSSIIGLEMAWEDNSRYNYSVSLNTPSDKHEWRYHSESLSMDGKRVWGRSGHSVEQYDNSVGMFMLEPNEALTKARSYVDSLRNYAIYQPSTPVLRGILSDYAQLNPLGLSGGRLAEAIEEIMYYQAFDQNYRDDSLTEDIQELIDWADDVDVSYPNKRNINSAVPASRRVIVFHDVFMKEMDRFTAYDASEGALYVLFLACLVFHPKAPRIFAVDNFDQSMNPRLARAVMKKFCNLVLKKDKTVFLTTHNPLALDGLDLNDPRIRLFSADRSHKTGEVMLKRIEVKRELLEQDLPLSRLWTSGIIGGVPNL